MEAPVQSGKSTVQLHLRLKEACMESSVHAQLMSQMCAPKFAALILRVPAAFADQQEIATAVIATIAHADKMAAICGPSAAADLMLSLAEKTLETATAERYSQQGEAVRILLAMFAHAHSMARTVGEAAEEILAVVRPLADQPLAGTAAEVARLVKERDRAIARIRDISHSVFMRRLLR
jgi:hypothetical protein